VLPIKENFLDWNKMDSWLDPSSWTAKILFDGNRDYVRCKGTEALLDHPAKGDITYRFSASDHAKERSDKILTMNVAIYYLDHGIASICFTTQSGTFSQEDSIWIAKEKTMPYVDTMVSVIKRTKTGPIYGLEFTANAIDMKNALKTAAP
jgi:hypothetical protein